MLRKRIGAGANNLPVIAKAEQLTFHQGAKLIIDDFVANNKKSLTVVQRRITKHLMPYFGGRRLIGITSGDVMAYIAKRRTDVINVRQAHTVTHQDGTTTDVAAVTKPVSNAEVNRELAILKCIFNLAIEGGRIAMKPKIKMLKEPPPRPGFFEPDQYQSVLKHLPAEIRPVISFAYITGWRIAAEVLPLEWRQVDFAASEIRLDPGTTKNHEGRTFPMTENLRAVLEAQHAKHERLKKAGQIERWVFFRMVDHRGKPEPKPITSFTKVWRSAWSRSGLPWPYSTRPPTHGGAELRAQRHLRERRHAVERAQDAVGVRSLRHRQQRRSQPCRS
jgi:integrase